MSMSAFERCHAIRSQRSAAHRHRRAAHGFHFRTEPSLDLLGKYPTAMGTADATARAVIASIE